MIKVMKIIEGEKVFKTSKNIELLNITPEVEKFVASSKVSLGLLTVVSLHTTTAIIINEDEVGLKKDFVFAQKLLARYKKLMRLLQHNKLDNNAAAHLSAGILGSSVSIIVKNGQPLLGTWQNVFFYELDGPRQRKVKFLLIGE